MLDGAVFSGCIHRLEDQQQGPAILGIEKVLKLSQQLHAHVKGFFGLSLVLFAKLKSVARIKLLELKLFAIINAKGFRELLRTCNEVLLFTVEDLAHDDSLLLHLASVTEGCFSLLRSQNVGVNGDCR